MQVAQGRIDETSCSDAARSGALPVPQPRWGSVKSKRVTWEDVAAADPDVVIVSCCGFDFGRNVTDGRAAAQEHAALRGLRALREGRFFAADGNRWAAAGSRARHTCARMLVSAARMPSCPECRDVCVRAPHSYSGRRCA